MIKGTKHLLAPKQSTKMSKMIQNDTFYRKGERRHAYP